MDKDFIDILKRLIAEQGKGSLIDHKKCKAFLYDYIGGDYKKESRWLLQAVEAGTARAIDTADDLVLRKKQLIQKLEEDIGLNAKVSADLVNALAFVLRGDTTVTEVEQTITAQQQFKPPPAVRPEVFTPPVKLTEELEKRYEEAHALYKAKQYSKAFPLIETLANEGYAKAQNLLAIFYEDGLVVSKDYIKTAELIKKAAEQGLAIAQFRLGNCYRDGKGVKKDKAKAREWYQKSIDQGLSNAIYPLSKL